MAGERVRCEKMKNTKRKSVIDKLKESSLTRQIYHREKVRNRVMKEFCLGRDESSIRC